MHSCMLVLHLLEITYVNPYLRK